MRKIKLPKLPQNIKRIFTRKRVFLSLVIILVTALLYVGRSLFFAAFVNKTPIFRVSLLRELEKQGGSQVLENLIDKVLVEQEAKKAKIVVTDEELDTQIKNIEDVIKAQGLTLEDALKFRGMTKNDLIAQIKMQEGIKKLLGPQITVTDEEIKDYFSKNKATFPVGSTLEKVKDQIQSALLQQKLSEKYSSWIADIRAKAKILYFLKF